MALPNKQSALTNSDADTIVKGFATTLGIKFDDSLDFFPVTKQSRDPNLWTATLPYRFVMVTASKDKNPSYNIISSGPASTAGVSQAIYTLPIAPQNISIQMPFASQTTVLSDGILVENNGIPIRMITISGTTGVLPFRSVSAPSYNNSVLGSLAGNTARSVSNTINAGKAIAGNIASGFGGAKADPTIQNSGYEQFHRLSDFLQIYALLAKDPQNNAVRLAFDMPKDAASYLVTPKSFTLTRSADSPLEYKYTIQMEAWKKVKISGYAKESVSSDLKTGIFSNLSKVQSIIQTLQDVRSAINGLANLANAVRTDVGVLVNGIREAILIAKDVANVAQSVIDLPNELITDIAGPILGAISDVKQAWQGVDASAAGFATGVTQAANAITALANQTFSDSSNPQTLYATQQSSSTLSGTTNSGNQNPSAPGPGGGATAPKSPDASIINSIIKDPITYGPYLDAININSLTIPKNVQKKIDEEVQRVKSLTRQDFQNRIDYVNSFSRDLAVSFGLGDPSYDSINGAVSVAYPPVSRTPSRKELDLLFAIRQYASALNEFAAFELSGDNAIQESFSFIGQIATSQGINLNTSQGKIAVPIPYGATIQEIAQQFTGDADNASEIILLNGLIAPYIDETGTILPFLSNGNLNSFSISNANDLYIGQKVILSSTIVPQFARKILSIKNSGPNHYLVTVDGNPTLGTLSSLQSAQIQYFARGSISSRDSIFVPAPVLPPDLPERLRPLPYYFNDVDNLAAFTGVDWALGSNNDIILTKNGDIALVGGIANLTQALRLKFLTPKGSLRRHPNYGFGLLPGTPTSDIDPIALKKDINQFIGSDPRFGEVQQMVITLQGPILAISGSVTVASVNKVLPFNLVVTP